MNEKPIQYIELLSKWTGKTCSWMILGIIGTIGYEVVSRYFFNKPTAWAHELSTMLFGSYCILVGAYTHLNNGHVRMDALYRRLSPKMQAKFDFFTGIPALCFLIIFFIIVTQFAIKSWKIREFSSMTSWAPPLYPLKMAIAVGVLLLIFQQVAVMIRSLFMITGKEDLLNKISSNNEGDHSSVGH